MNPYLVPRNPQAVIAMLEEYAFTCPYCLQPISMLLDLSVKEQAYVEDCEVCCRPIDISVTVGSDAEPSVTVSQENEV